MRVMPNALIEEFVEDTRKLAERIGEWADRWGKYGTSIESLISESRRADVMAAFEKLSATVDGMEIE